MKTAPHLADILIRLIVSRGVFSFLASVDIHDMRINHDFLAMVSGPPTLASGPPSCPFCPPWLKSPVTPLQVFVRES